MLVVLTPILGAMGAALATLVGNLISSNLNLVFLSRAFGVSPLRFYGLRRTDIGTILRFVGRMRRFRAG
jgi:Na+-driven multidrug efflux pump